MKPKLIVTRHAPKAVLQRMQSEFDSVVTETEMSTDEAITAARSLKADALFLSGRFKLGADAIASFPGHVRIAATCAVGYDNIDVAAAKARAGGYQCAGSSDRLHRRPRLHLDLELAGECRNTARSCSRAGVAPSVSTNASACGPAAGRWPSSAWAASAKP